ncbi:Tat binding protein 1-interacting protein-domain-containing protein [Massariosphaeria phaeospora]|uniref:Tat binding protein 1-interacting protein-domain-containing protein n=1 Tax=Massariosphaeria phaeospora TaxID=100035 RepID=A0A7C8MJW1_9PLEO|nr:Tat binding protein 1-interacting protein-domain-containing protein [Massariosphaeria phaeospora]
MAPRKEKAEKVSVNDSVDMILNYLRKQNRPYSATDISANLHNKVTKAAAAKILKDLHERNEVEGRPAGKQIVYHALQSPSDSCNPSNLAALNTTINDLRTSTTNLQATAKTLRSTLASLNSTLSTADLIANVAALEAEQAQIRARLELLKAGKAKKVTKKEMDGVDEEWKKWQGVARRREKVSAEMWRLIEDVLPDREKRGEVRESLGLDE